MDEDTKSGTGPTGERGREIRRLTRRLDRKVVAGVAAGLGEYFAVDPVLFRVAFIVLALFGGVGILIYGLAWWIVPAEPVPATGQPWTDSRGERVMRRLKGSPVWVGVALLIVGAAVLVRDIGLWNPAIVWGVTLIALGVLLFRQGAVGDSEDRRRAGSAASRHAALDASSSVGGATIATEEPALPSSSAPLARMEEGSIAAQPYGAPAVAPARPARTRRERSSLGWITLGALLFAIGVAAVLENGDIVSVSLVQFLALALAVLGAGLLVGARWGHARWLIVPGLLLIPFVLAASLIDVPLRGGFGEHVFRPTAVAEVRGTYRLTGGREILDLQAVPAQGRILRITSTVGFGQLEVIVPRGVTIEVHGRAGAGDVDLFGERFDGLKVDVRRTARSAGSSGTINLELAAGFGQVVVSYFDHVSG